MKTIAIAASLLAVLAATPAFANDGCRPGDRIVMKDGKRMCAHNDSKGPRVPVARASHRATAPTVIMGAPVDDAGAIKITTQHKFVGSVAQFRCSFTTNGQRIKHEGNTAGTGWCHD